MSLFNQNNSNNQDDQDNSVNEAYSSLKRNRTSSILIFVIIIAGYFIYTSIANSTSCAGETTTGRVKLEPTQCHIVQTWYDKETEYTQNATLEGMVTFYETTGIQPIVTIADGETELTQEELNAKAEDYYKNNLFDGITDEGHTVVAFQPSNGAAGIYSGTDARKVMDADAVPKFMNILQKNYNSKKGTDVLSKTFREAAGTIMGRTKSSLYLIIILGVACVGYLVYGFIRVKKQQGGQN